MTDQRIRPRLDELESLESALQHHRDAMGQGACAPRPLPKPAGVSASRSWPRRAWRQARAASKRVRVTVRGVRWRVFWTHPAVIVAGAASAAVAIAAGLIMWRLASGPIPLDIVTPWLTAAIQDNFGGDRRIEIGGTQLQRDEHGRTALRIRDIVVRDADGTIIASAPGAEVGFSGNSLMAGKLRAQRLSLVGARVAVRIEEDGQLTIFTGEDKRPFATAPANVVDGGAPSRETPTPATPAPGSADPDQTADPLRRLVAWIDGLGAAGFDGIQLAEIGVKSGYVFFDDRRNGRNWSFEGIDLNLTRLAGGELRLSIGSSTATQPWNLQAALSPAVSGRRLVVIEGNKIPVGDLVMAAPLTAGKIEANLPLSLAFRAEIGRDGIPERATGRVTIENAEIVPIRNPRGRIPIQSASLTINWDGARRIAAMPFQIVGGGTRFTLLAQAEAPRTPGAPWNFALTGGSIVLGPVGAADRDPLVIDRVLVRGRCNPGQQLLQVDQGEIGSRDLAVAFSGSLDYSTNDPRLAAGIAGRNLNAATLKQLWPVFANATLREWIIENLHGAAIDRFELATNAPLSHFHKDGPPLAEDELSLSVTTAATVIRPLPGLPAIRDADLAVRIIGPKARVELGRGSVELPSGRKLAITGAFDVPNTQMRDPASVTRFRIEGPVAAAAELLDADALRGTSGIPIDPATARGTVVAQVSLDMPIADDPPPGTVQYAITADITNFAAERVVMGQRLESQSLRIAADANGHGFRGDVRIGGVAAALDYRKSKDSEPEVRLTATLDEPTRTRLAFDSQGMLKGPVPIKLTGRVAQPDRESRYAVEADLTQARIDQLFPGWQKPAGRPAKASFTIVNRPRSTRIEDITVEGAGSLVRGTIELGQDGDLQSIILPVFAMSEGDKTSLRAERSSDGTLRVSVRGDVFDGRAFVKSQLATPSGDQRARASIPDLDLDIKVGAVVGHSGEALRGLDLKLSRRGGEVRSLSVGGKIGNESILGDLRARAGRQVIYLESADAGAVFRFADIYSRIQGGKMWLAMDPPSKARTLQEGVLNVRDFSVRGEQALEKVIGNQQQGDNPTPVRNGIDFSRLHLEFARSPGNLSIREGIVRGPAMGATIDGRIDYARDDVRLRGTFIPLYGLNNMFGQLPILGIFLGGGNKEGLVGITYEVVGPPASPTLRVNPISAVAPGLLRKVFEFPAVNERGVSERSPTDRNAIERDGLDRNGVDRNIPGRR